MRKRAAHLGVPPPFPCMHVKVNPYGVIFIRIVALRGEDEDPRKLRVSKECTNTFNDVAVVDLKDFLVDVHLATYEARASRAQVVVDDGVQLLGRLI